MSKPEAVGHRGLFEAFKNVMLVRRGFLLSPAALSVIIVVVRKEKGLGKSVLPSSKLDLATGQKQNKKIVKVGPEGLARTFQRNRSVCDFYVNNLLIKCKSSLYST